MTGTTSVDTVDSLGTVDMVPTLNDLTSVMAAVSLDEVLRRAALHTRVDRKYVVPAASLLAVVAELGDELLVLEAGGVRDFRYESVYFDTATLASYRAAAHGRRRRFKVRTRSYLDSGSCFLEVKRTNGRGETVKERLPYALDDRFRVDDEGRRFVAARVAVDGDLEPTLTTRYRRTTLLDPTSGMRITCDAGLVCAAPDGAFVTLDHAVLVETKSQGAAAPVDRLLWAHGHRPEPVSKYGVGMACLTPGLPANKWSRTLRRHFGWSPGQPRGS